MHYKNEGVKQAFQLSVDERFYVPNYKAHLPSSEEWVVKTFDLNNSKQYRLGEATVQQLNERPYKKLSG